METCQAIASLLDDTIGALALLDLDRLQSLEREAEALADAKPIGDKAGVHTVLEKRCVLERVLNESASNLAALNRLYERRTREQWERLLR